MTEWVTAVGVDEGVEYRSEKSDKGGTMRLGRYCTLIKPDTLASSIYKKDCIYERHRHRYEVNNLYVDSMEQNGMICSGMSKNNQSLKGISKYRDMSLPEIIELRDHKFFIGIQFHPEYKSRPLKPHPMFKSFISKLMKIE